MRNAVCSLNIDLVFVCMCRITCDAMSAKKRHHFVPQFYLRNFSRPRGERVISVYNSRSEKFVTKASVRGQAYKNHWYGLGDEIEDCLAMIEGRAATVISSIIENSELPNTNSEDYQSLVLFLVQLRHRTFSAGQEQNEMMNLFMKATMSEGFQSSSEFDKEIQGTRFFYEHPALAALGSWPDVFPFALDLKCKLITIHGDREFLTSDNPVVLYNQFLERRKPIGGITGWATKGLQAFLPISSNHLLCFYDGGVYKYGNRRQNAISIQEMRDVDDLNSLQCMNLEENLYCSPGRKEEEVSRLVARYMRNRPKSRVNLRRGRLIEGDDVRDGTLLHIYKHDLRCALRLTFIRELKRTRKFKVGNRVFLPRNPAIQQAYEDFQQMVKSGNYKHGQFFHFLSDIRRGHLRSASTQC